MSNIEDDIKKLNKFNEYENAVVLSEEALYEIQEAIEHILSEREQDKKRIQELEEYISIAPNLDEMTATKFINIQREAYIRGKAEEQQRAEQIIYENYIPKQAIIDLIENETINISGFECVAVEDIQELLEGEK